MRQRWTVLENLLVSWSRRATITYGIAVAAIAVIVALVVAPALKRRELATIEKILSAAADDRAAAINNIMANAMADAKSIANFPTLVYVAEGRTDPPYPFPREEGAARHLTTLFRGHADADGERDIIFFDRSAKVIAAASGRRESYADAAHGLARQVLRADTQIADVFFVGDAAYVILAAPVLDARGGSIGVLVSVIDPRTHIFPPVLAKHGAHSRTLETVLATRRGRSAVVFSPLARAKGFVTSSDTIVASVAAVNGRSNLGEFRDYSGAKVIAATRPLQSVPWGLAVKIDKSVVLAGYYRNLAATIGIAAALSVLIAGIIHTLRLAAKVERAQLQVAHERQRQRADEELRQSFQLLSAITESTTDPIFAKDLDGRYIFINTPGAAAAGRTPRQICGKTDAELFPAEIARTFTKGDTAVLANGMPVTLEQSGDYGKGERIWLVNKSPLRDADGRINGVIGISKDITDKKNEDSALHKHQERFRSLFEHAPMGVLVGSTSGALVEVNPALAEMLGYTQEELTQMTVWDIAPVEDHDAEHQWMAQAVLPGNEHFKRDKRYVRKDGAIIWVHLSGTLIRSSDGSSDYFMIGVEEITDRLASEQKLIASERRFRTLYETMAQGVVYMSPDGHYFDANTAAKQILGLPADLNTTGSSDPAWQPQREDGTPIPFSELPSQIVFKTGKTVKDHLFTVYNKKDKIRKHLLVNAHPLYEDGSDKPHKVYATFTDLTALRTTETALRHAKENFENANARLQRLLEANVVGFVITKGDGSVLEANDYYLDTLGYTRDELRAGKMRWTEFTPAEHHAADMRALDELRATGSAAPYEKEQIRKDGKRVWVLVGHTVLPGCDDDPQYLGWTVNITAQKELQTQLQQAQRMEAIGRLAGGVAHDFNNILTAIRGLADIVCDDTSVSANSYADLQEIIRSADRATALTRQLLAFSRRQMLQPRNVNLGELVDGMQRMLGRLIGEDIEVRVVRPRETLHTFADPGQLEQVLLNLAVNARDAMPAGGRLTIGIAPAPADAAREHGGGNQTDYVVLSVSDTGCGMSEETLELIFEPFFTTKEQGKGTGLGLATVYGIVRQSGGWLTVSSEVGKGSMFHVYLPRGVKETTQPQNEADVQRKRAIATILLVEDEDGVRNVARRVLTRQGHHILEASNGADALKIAAQHAHIDLVVTDIVMPGMSGPELVERLREIKPAAKAILMSGYSKEALPPAFAANLSSNFLEKPFTPAALVQKIDNLLAAN
jgi:two-component system, cell cycle sensor histidine kinase and response regulator CckA